MFIGFHAKHTVQDTIAWVDLTLKIWDPVIQNRANLKLVRVIKVIPNLMFL